MISALASHSPSVKQIFNFNEFNLTEAKTKQIALSFFTVLSFTIGCIALSIGTSAACFFAIPCFIASGALLWILTVVKDYQDPSALQKMRSVAAGRPLIWIIKEHGWEKMMQYGIPEPKLFYEKCYDTMRELSTIDLIHFFELAVKMKDQYGAHEIAIPHPTHFKEKFAAETKLMSACEMFDKFDFQLLSKYELISSALFKAHEQYRTLQTTYQKALQTKNEYFSEICRNELKKFKTVLDYSIETRHDQIHWISQLNRDVRYLANLPCENWFTGTLEIMTEFPHLNRENWHDLSHTIEAQDAFQKATKGAKAARDAQIKQLGDTFSTRCKEINARFQV